MFIPRANYGREYKNVPSNLPSSDNFLRLSAKSYLEMGGAWVDGARNSSGDTSVFARVARFTIGTGGRTRGKGEKEEEEEVVAE